VPDQAPHTVAVLALDAVVPLDLGIPIQMFATRDVGEPGLPNRRVRLHPLGSARPAASTSLSGALWTTSPAPTP
jgi:hypothetical protein